MWPKSVWFSSFRLATRVVPVLSNLWLCSWIRLYSWIYLSPSNQWQLERYFPGFPSLKVQQSKWWPVSLGRRVDPTYMKFHYMCFDCLFITQLSSHCTLAIKTFKNLISTSIGFSRKAGTGNPNICTKWQSTYPPQNYHSPWKWVLPKGS